MSLVARSERADDWRALGACRGKDPTLWYPSRGESCSEAKAICHECPVELSCREYALDNLETIGIWGGLSERERKRIRRDTRFGLRSVG